MKRIFATIEEWNEEEVKVHMMRTIRLLLKNDDIYDSFMKQYPNVGNFIITQMSKSPNMIPFLQEAISAFRNAMRKVQYLETVRAADTVVFLKLLRDPKN